MKRKTCLHFLFLSLVFTSFAMAASGDYKTFHQQQKEKMKAHYSQQTAEKKAFYKSVNGLPYQQKFKTIADYHEKNFQENMTFRRQMHQEDMDSLKQADDKNSKLTEEQKQNWLNFQNSQFADTVKFLEEQHQKDDGFYRSLADTAGLTPRQIKEKLKAHRSEQKTARNNFYQTRKTSTKTKWKELHPAAKKDKKQKKENKT